MDIVVSSDERDWLGWARQYAAADPAQRAVIESSSRGTLAAIRRQSLEAILQAAGQAGNGGRVIFCVGHGAASDTDDRIGFIDLAPRSALRVTQDHVLFWESQYRESDARLIAEAEQAGTSRCRRFRRAGSIDRIPADQQFQALACSAAPTSRERMEVRAAYEAIGAALRRARAAEAVFVTCRVGRAQTFVDRIAADWGVTVVAYRERVAAVRDEGDQYRIYIATDQPGQGTNTDRARTELPNRQAYRAGPPGGDDAPGRGRAR